MRGRQQAIGWLCCALALANASACTRFKVQTSPLAGAAIGAAAGAAGVSFRSFEHDGDVRHARPFDGRVQVDLWREVGDHWELVVRSDAPEWSRADLVPGEYRLELGAITTDGEVDDPAGRTRARFTLAEGETTDVRVTLRSTPWETLVVITVAAVVVAVVVVAVVARQGKLPEPGVLRPPRFRPPPPFFPPHPHPHVVYVPVVVDWYWTPVPYRPEEADRARITSLALPGPDHPDGAVLIGFDRPMDGAYFGPDTLQLADAAGRPVATGVYYDGARQTARVTPLRPLPDGDYALTVLAPELRDTRGKPPLDAAFVRRFHIGPEAAEPPTPRSEGREPDAVPLAIPVE